MPMSGRVRAHSFLGLVVGNRQPSQRIGPRSPTSPPENVRYPRSCGRFRFRIDCAQHRLREPHSCHVTRNVHASASVTSQVSCTVVALRPPESTTRVSSNAHVHSHNALTRNVSAIRTTVSPPCTGIADTLPHV